MKYDDRFWTDDELRMKCLLKAGVSRKCSQCGANTIYIDYCTEQYICSEECMKTQNNKLNNIGKFNVEELCIKEDCFYSVYDLCEEPWTCEDCKGYIGLGSEEGEEIEDRYLVDTKKVLEPIKDLYRNELIEKIEEL